MALDKRLRLGGLQVGGPRTMQSPARFRVANNVYQTRKDVMVPRFDNTQTNDFSASTSKIIHTARYEESPFYVGVNPAKSAPLFFDRNYSAISSSGFTVSNYWNSNVNLSSDGIQFTEKLGCLYMNIPQKGLFKYDGFQVYRAGVPIPHFSSTEYAASGACFVRVIQHHIDQQGNISHSGYVEFRATPATNVVNIRHDKLTTEIVKNGATTPALRTEEQISLSSGYMSHFFKRVSHVFSAVNNDVVVTTGGDHNVAVGGYVIVSMDYKSAASTGLSLDIRGLAHKVKSFTGTTVTLDLAASRILQVDGSWATVAYPTDAAAEAQWINEDGGSNYWLSVWTSDQTTGVYYFRHFFPCFYESTVSSTEAVTVGAAPYNVSAGVISDAKVTQSGLNMVPNLSEFYDVTSVKMVFPVTNSKSFSTYQDLAIISYENEIYFSDTTLGGAFEMTNGLAFIVVGEGNDGKIQSVCGNSDFLLVSRQYQNYYVSGNLPTANYRRQAIEKTQNGCYSNESSIAVGSKIIFINKTGVYALYAGGKCEEVSEQIKGLYEDYSETVAYPEDTYFDISSFQEFAVKGAPIAGDEWVRLRLDVNRGLLAFLTHGGGSGEALVLNLNSGEFYTWSGLLEGVAGTKDIKDMCFISGKYHLTRNGTAHAVGSENKILSWPYAATLPPTLEGTWFTAGEPSLDKKLNQVKIFGKINGSIAVSHKLDWKTNTSVTDDTYTNADEILFSHKKRLTPANFQSVSVKLEMGSSSTRFEIEGIEIEWQPLQENMKR